MPYELKLHLSGFKHLSTSALKTLSFTQQALNIETTGIKWVKDVDTHCVHIKYKIRFGLMFIY